jgi:hypothetical protein
MDDIIPNTSVDHVTEPADGLIVDNGILGITTATTAVVPPKKQRHVFRRLTKGDTYPFLLHPDAKEITMYRCLAISQPFATPKYKGVTEAWNAAVADINNLRNDPTTGIRVFDPPVSVKAVRDRFESAMTIVQHLLHTNAFPFRNHGRDDDENDKPSSLMQILVELYEQKTALEAKPTGGVNDSTLPTKKDESTTLATKKKDDSTTLLLPTKKKKDREEDAHDAKAIQDEPTIGVWSSSDDDSEEDDDDSETVFSSDDSSSNHQKKKKAKTDVDENEKEKEKVLAFLSATLTSLKEARRAGKQADQEFKIRKAELKMEWKKQQLEWKKQQLEWKKQQMEMDQRQAEQRMEWTKQQMEMDQRQAEHQMGMSLRMIHMMKTITEKLG